ncbi:flippase [uncultured Methanobrevibacter sp.]|uniref:flippase n=1 Tax=uncultured Methanobrevibacter sp. TaxID=253161 RepID=UPI0025D3DAF7|nr:flippase [uncultured Methanobrevibacter sp.]
MSEILKIFKNSGWMMSSQIITAICGFLWTIIIARYLGASNLGILSFAISLSVVFGMFMDFGISQLLIRDVSREHNLLPGILNNAIPLKIISSIFVISFIGLILYLKGDTKIVITVCLLIGIENLFVNMNLIFSAVFQAYEKMAYTAKGTLINSLILLSLVIICAYLNLGLIGITLSYLISYIISYLYLRIQVSKKIYSPKYKFNFKYWKLLIKRSIPFGLMNLFNSIYFNIDMAMLGFLTTAFSTGIYNASYKIITILTTLYTVYTAVIFPVMSKLYKNSDNLLKLSYEKSVKYLLLISIPISIGVFIYAESIITLIYGKSYISSSIIIQFLIFTIPFLFINGSGGLLLNSIHKERTNTKIYGTAVLVNVLLNLFLISQYQELGAAISTVVSEIYIFVLMFILIYKTDYHPSIKILYDVIKIIISSVIMGLVLYYIGVNLWMGTILGIIIYFICLILLRLFDEIDKSIINNIIHRK